MPRITDCSHLGKQPLLDGREEKVEFLWTTFHHQLAVHQRCLKSTPNANVSQQLVTKYDNHEKKKRRTARRAGAGRAVDCRLRPDGKFRLRTTRAAVLKLCLRDSRGARRPDGKCRHDRRLTSFGPCERPSFFLGPCKRPSVCFLAGAQPRPA